MCFISQDKWQMSQESQEITPLALLKQSLWLTYNILGKKGKKAIKFGIMAWWGDTAVLLFFNTQ